MQEHLDVSIEFGLLLTFDDLFDLPLLDNILCLLIMDCFDLLLHLYFNLGLEFSELLGLLSDVLMHPQLHLVQILLIDLSSFPHGEALLGFRLAFALLHVHSGC